MTTYARALTIALLAAVAAMVPFRAVDVFGQSAGSRSAVPLRSDGGSVFADVAERVSPGVVFIRVEKTSAGEQRNTPFEFFHDFTPDDRDAPRGRESGGGSGFIIDDDGRIITNYHVIRDADRITVVVGDGGDDENEFDAEVVGGDPHTDIAIIQIRPNRKLAAVPLGDSDAMRVGDWVMAIGTPFGQLLHSVTVGIVSAKGRNDLNIVGGAATYQNYLQTDASINFGNSGGPLVNLRGEAIGINTAINPAGQGIGFAIPINMAKKIMSELIANGRVAYGYIGISLRRMDRTLAAGRGMEIDHGILVEDVLPNTPAANCGLKTGDVIVRYNGQDVRDDNRFRRMVGETRIGTRVPVEVVRGKEKRQLELTVAERPEQAIASAEPKAEGGAWLGLHVDDASKREHRRQYAIDRDQEGVVVLGVENGSPADEAGIREGDVITEVYSHQVSNLGQYVEVAKKLKDRKDPIAFLVKSGRSTRFIPVQPEAR